MSPISIKINTSQKIFKEGSYVGKNGAMVVMRHNGAIQKLVRGQSGNIEDLIANGNANVATEENTKIVY